MATNTTATGASAPPLIGKNALPQGFTRGMRSWFLILICATSLFNFLDRQVFAIILQPMKLEIGATDTEMGFLTGGAFALVYVLAGIPLARLADRGTRKTILGWTLFVWSVMTLFCGFGRNYGQILLCRMGVAIGEAGSMPASYSVIPDLYPPERRSRVIGLFYFASAMGIAASLFIGGRLQQMVGWRYTLMIVGAPGMILSLLIFLTVREPLRTHAMTDRPSMVTALKDAWRYPTFRVVLILAMLSSFAGYSILGWAPTFLMRVHKMSAVEVGGLMGFGMLCGAAGSFISGQVSDRLAARDPRRLFWVAAIGPLLSIPCCAMFFWGPTGPVMVASYALFQFLFAVWQPPCFAAVVNVTSGSNRGLATAVITMFQNIGGVALGPVVVGMLNDHFLATLGQDGIRTSLSIVATGLIGVVVCGLIGVRVVRADYVRAEVERAAE